jgi:predicted aldo/keto reductase-like oxidoreductase
MMKRRKFIAGALAGSGLMGLSFNPLWSANSLSPDKPVPKRALGRSKIQISALGFGGIMLNNEPQDVCNNLIARSWEAGIDYYDVAPSYGNAEEKMGPALEPYRKKSFLSCKSGQRDKAGVEKELHESFRKLRTDYFDLYQLHALGNVDDVERSFAPGGAMEAILKAKEQGKVRLIGFSAHSEEAALRALEYFDFDTVMYPINFVCWHSGNFGPSVYRKAVERDLGILVLKSLAERGLRHGEERFFSNVWYKPVLDDALFDQALAFSLSRRVTSVIPPGNAGLYLKAIERVHHYSPLTDAGEEELKNKAREIEPLFRA